MNLVKTGSEKEIISPSVHLNGSGKERLLSQYKELNFLIQKTAQTLIKYKPHPRDYYVQENQITPSGKPYKRAHAEYMERLQHLFTMAEEIQTIIEDIDNA